MNPNAVLGILILFIAGFCLILIPVFVVFYKIRKIHIAVFNIEEIRREVFAIFPQIQALNALEKIICLPYPLPPTRGWAGSPDFLLEIVEEIVKRRPKIVMECSSGVSTIVIARVLQMNGIGHVYSLEHNIDYGQRTRELLKKYNLIEWATVIDAPLTTCLTGQPWYDLKMLPQSAINVEVVIVDGPPEDTSRLARYPALPCLLDRLAASTLILVDDASRPDEISTIRKWIQEFPDFTHRALNCEKGCAFVERSAITHT